MFRHLLAFGILVLLVGSSEGEFKARFFLQNKYIDGSPISLSDLDDDDEKTPGAHKVLYGHYTQTIESRKNQGPAKITKPKLSQKTPGGPPWYIYRNQKLNQSRQQKPNPRSLSPRLLPLLPALIDLIRDNLQVSISAAANLTLGGKSPEFESKEKNCESQAQACESNPGKLVLCRMECLVQGNPILQDKAQLITNFIDTYCPALETVFHKIFQYVGKNYEQFRSFPTFLKSFLLARRDLNEIKIHAWESVMSAIIDLVQTDFMPFRLVNGIMSRGLSNIGSARTDTFLINRLCMKLDGTPVMTTLLDVLHRDTVLTDVLLKGFSTLNLITKYVPNAHQEAFAAVIGGIRFLTGTSCGVVDYAETGNSPKCDQIGGIPVAGMPLPQSEGMKPPAALRPECMQDGIQKRSDAADYDTSGARLG